MTTRPITIRMATAADHDAWHPLWRGYQAFYQVDLPESTTATTRVLYDQVAEKPGFVQYRRNL